LTRSAGSILIFKKVQSGVVLVKKKKSTGYNRILPGHQVFDRECLTPGVITMDVTEAKMKKVYITRNFDQFTFSTCYVFV
jgi:hypothetical protein